MILETVFFLSVLGVADSTITADTPAPVIMQQFLQHFVQLQPFLSSEEAFSKKNNAEEILTHITELGRISHLIDHSSQLKKDGFRITGKAMQNHLGDLEKVFKKGNKSYARSMMMATFDGCASCHTQIPAKSLTWDIEKILPAGISAFDKGEFLYVTRHWDQAFVIFDSLMMHYPEEKLKETQLTKILNFKLAYFLRIKRDIVGAENGFERYLENSKLPSDIRARISHLNFLLRVLKSSKAPNPQTVKADVLERYVQGILDPTERAVEMDFTETHRATFLYISGLLFEFINTRKESELSPGLFYWLSVCDRWLNNQFFFSLSDQYLKECITRFPKSSTAKKCFAEYDYQTRLAYTGSSGENLPEDVANDLLVLKDTLDGKVTSKKQKK